MKYYDHKGELCSEKYYIQFRDEWLAECQKLVSEHMRNYSWKNKLSVHTGRRYDKIISTDTTGNGLTGNKPSSRVWAFVDKTNGDILKPESWKKPAKHARGNIYEEDRMLFMSHSGPAYMDTIKEYYGV